MSHLGEDVEMVGSDRIGNMPIYRKYNLRGGNYDIVKESLMGNIYLYIKMTE